MPLTPIDLEQIAALVKAGQCGYLPPYLLGQQLALVTTTFLPIDRDGLVAFPNPNRVALGIGSQVGFSVFPATSPDPNQIGWTVPSNGVIWFDLPKHGVLPQLAWCQVNAAGSWWTTYELIWSPPPTSGLGVV